jgi:UDP-N-acetylglucosamine--N-acetylmuramyl-(pentapeptide) pyrophosphoryl-undecaprenol N-acetylglucosamine transferase
MPNPLRLVISGGGTGGHIFPAVSIAQEVQRRYPEADIRFIGAQGRMEMERVPAAGYPITGIPIAGFQRKALHKNLSLPLKIWKSLRMVRQHLSDWQPHAVIGTGGYVSGPTLFVAQRMSIPTLIQEQNSFAGWTNRLVSRRAKAICTAYPGMEAVFPAAVTYQTGNPVRPAIAGMPSITEEARRAAKVQMGFEAGKALILVLGGSQGARAINQAVEAAEAGWRESGHQVLWQCGKFYVESLQSRLGEVPGRRIQAFLDDMVLAYTAADLVVSRAGAGTLSELCCAGIASILIPSPNVAEDHQTHNALSLHDRGAALHLPESKAFEKLAQTVEDFLADAQKLESLRSGARHLAQPNAAFDIVNHLETLWTWKA